MKITSYTQARARDFGFINVVLPYYHACLLCKLIKLCTFAVVYVDSIEFYLMKR